MLSRFSRVQLFATPWTVALQAHLSTEFSRHEYRSGLPFPYPGDLPNPGINPGSPALQGDALLPELLGRPMLDFLGGLIYESARLGILLLLVLQISEWNLDISATVNIWTERLNWTELNWKRLPQGNFLCFHWKCICSSLWKRLKVYNWASGRGQTSLSTSIFKKQTCYYQVTLIFHFQIKLKLSSKNLYWKIPNFRKEFMFK